MTSSVAHDRAYQIRPARTDTRPSALLVRVDSVQEEAAVLRSLGTIERRTGCPVAPVLSQGGLVQRAARALRTAGLRVHVVERSDLASRNGPITGRRSAPPDRPDSVVVTDHVPPRLAALTGTLCGTTPQTLEQLREGRELGASVVILTNSRKPTRTLPAIMELVAARSRPAGLIDCSDRLTGRELILKALLVSRIPYEGVLAVLSGMYGPTADEAAPGWLAPRNAGPGSRLDDRPLDLFIANGHSNPLDAEIGNETILCSRTEVHGGREDRGVFPCFRDGLCFRRQENGSATAAKLVHPSEIRAKVAVLSGCNYLPLGPSWSNPGYGLAWQLARAAPLATVASTTLTPSVLETDLFLAALLLDGVPLGQALLRVNSMVGELCENGRGAENRPYVLLGNPCLRISSERVPVETVVVGEPSGRPSVSIRLPSTVAGEDGCLIRLSDLPVDLSAGSGPLTMVNSDGPGLWARGAITGSDAYLFLRDGRTASTGAAEATLEAVPDTLGPARNQIATSIGSSPFWTLFLDHYRQVFERGDLDGSTLSLAQESVPSYIRAASRALAGGPDSSFVVRWSERSVERYATLLEKLVASHSRVLLKAAIEIACFDNIRDFSFTGIYQRHRREVIARKCACGADDVLAERLAVPGSTIERTLYHCQNCGPVGEDDGGGAVALRHPPVKRGDGRSLTVAYQCRASEDARLAVAGAAVLEDWRRTRSTVGTRTELRLRPGETGRAESRITIPSGLTPGVHPVSLIAIANGSLSVRVTMCDV